MSSGYVSCACRDCFEIAIASEGEARALCHECDEAGCEACDCADPERGCPHGECCAPNAYGAGDVEELVNELLRKG